MVTEDTLKEAVHATIAQQIVNALDQGHRDALIKESMKKVVGDWQFRSAIAGVASAKANEVAAKLFNTEEWEKEIETAIKLGFEDYIRDLRIATRRALADMMNGKAGHNAAPGIVVRYLDRKD